MKKLIFLFCILIGSLTSCDPMDDVYADLDKLPRPNSEIKNISITLSETDYKSLAGKPNVPSSVDKGFYFSSEDQAIAIVPVYLSATYPQLENQDAINVTYNQLAFPFSNNTVSERVSYSLVNTDYALGGASFANFDRWSQIETFLNAQYPTQQEGRLATLTFTWFNTNVNPTSKSLTDTYYYKNGKWWDTYLVSAAEYAAIDRGRFNNFIAADQALLPDYFNRFLKASLVGSKVNDIQYVSFANRPAGTTTQDVMAMVYNGADWVGVNKNITLPVTLKFVLKNGVWAPDRTISHTFVTADYQWIADDANGIGTASNRANLKSFNNFFQQTPTDTRYWTDDQIKLGIAGRLKVLYPAVDAGQKYRVTYIAYTGSNTTKSMTFEKNASGNFDFVE